jgi:hypothetical protein
MYNDAKAARNGLCTSVISRSRQSFRPAVWGRQHVSTPLVGAIDYCLRTWISPVSQSISATKFPGVSESNVNPIATHSCDLAWKWLVARLPTTIEASLGSSTGTIFVPQAFRSMSKQKGLSGTDGRTVTFSEPLKNCRGSHVGSLRPPSLRLLFHHYLFFL